MAILAAVLLTCAGASMFQVEPLFLGAAAVAMGLDESQIGLLAGIELIGAAIGSVAAVFWVTRLNWRKVAATSLLVIVIGDLLSTIPEQLDQLIAIRFVTGFLGHGTAYAVALAVISDMRNPERVFGLAVACQVGLTVVAMLLMPGAISAWGTHGVLIPLALFALSILPAAWRIPTQVSVSSRPVDALASGSVFAIFLALGAQIVWYLGVGAVWAFIERIGAAAQIGPDSIGAALAIGIGIGIAGALLASLIGNRWGRLGMYAAAILGQILALYMLAGDLDWPTFALSVTLFNVSWNFALPFLLGAIAVQDPTGRFTVLIIAAQGLGVAIGPIIAGFLGEGMGLRSISYFGMLACALSLVMFAGVVRASRLHAKHPG